MAGQFIQLKDVLKQMRTYAPFSIEWVGADLKRKKAGKWFELESCALSSPNDSKKKGAPGAESKFSAPKNPHAMEHDTINIMNLKNRDILTVHLRLIKVFNGKSVIY